MATAKTGERPPPEHFEATPGEDYATVIERYPNGRAEDAKKIAAIKALMAASRKAAPATKHLASPNGYRTVNKQLRGGAVIKRDRAKIAETVAALDRCFAEPVFKTPVEITLWRAITQQFAKDLDKATDGVFHDLGYVIAATSERPLPLAIQIVVKAGTPVIPLAPYLAGSVLLNRDRSYKITGVVDRPDGRRRYLARLED